MQDTSGLAVTFQLTRSVGSVTRKDKKAKIYSRISTHTLRGERDQQTITQQSQQRISTHTLRGERDSLNFQMILKV